MRLSHFEAFRPVCPVCLRGGAGAHGLVLAAVEDGDETAVAMGVLRCANALCQHEYPIVDGIPIIVPDVRGLMATRGVELFTRTDLPPVVESVLGDAIGPDSWFDATRQTVSTYAWDGYADLDPAEAACAAGEGPGAARRCVARLLDLAPAEGPVARAVDLGCAAGRTSFELAATHPEALVLGCDLHLGLLRIAQAAGRGRVDYARRRSGLVYDRRGFDADLPGAARVDFWACDAMALPLAEPGLDLVTALNLLDCVPDPALLLRTLAGLLRPGGRMLLSTPYDWSTRATPVEGWIGGHSQRADHGGDGAARLREIFASGYVGAGLVAEVADWPWHTRLHDRAVVAYRTHLVAARRVA